MSKKRTSLGRKLRFEVFKRDGFKCRYCGRSAPDVVLQVDHIEPVALGGTNDLLNLVTSCVDCNQGKGARRLSDDTVLQKEKQQLDLLNERREQLEMMMQWRKELSELDNRAASYVASCFFEKTGYSLNEKGMHILRRILNKFTLSEVLDALDASAAHFGQYDSASRLTQASADKVLNMIYPIAKHNRDGDNSFGENSIYYVTGILHNRFGYAKKQFLPRLRKAEQCGIEPQKIKEIALTAKNYKTWRIAMEDLIETATAR